MTAVRHFTDDMLGKPCPDCRVPLPLSLIHVGIHRHPTCGEDVADLLARDAATRREET